MLTSQGKLSRRAANTGDHNPQGRRGGWHVAPEEAPTPPPVEDAKTQAKLGEAGEHLAEGPAAAEELRGDW